MLTGMEHSHRSGCSQKAVDCVVVWLCCVAENTSEAVIASGRGGLLHDFLLDYISKILMTLKLLSYTY